MAEETTLEALRRLDPSHRYFMGAITGRIFVEIDDMSIHDPFMSECGRFPCTPDYYGIPIKAAVVMMGHNMWLPEFSGELEEMV